MNSFIIGPDAGRGGHLYQQIYESIRRQIREGRLLFGEKLPSTRILAQQLGVSRSTAELAYAQLSAEGYIEAKPCRGYYVCRIEGMYELPGDQTRVEEAQPGEEESGEEYFVDFSPYAVDLSSFPFDTWGRITRNVLGAGDRTLFALGRPQGDRELRVTISRYLRASRGVECGPEQIIVGAGNDYLLMLLNQMLDKKLTAALENPTYRRAYRLFRSFGYQIVPVGMDASGMRADLLEQSGASLAYVMPSHQFPTGTVMPIGRRLELLKWASGAPGRYLIEDDYDSEFRYVGRPVPALQSSDRQGRAVYIGTFSKSIAPAVRISYMVLPAGLLPVYREKCAYLSQTVPRLDQAVLNEFIRDGYFERHLNRMRKLYKGKHDLLLDRLEPFRKSFRISGENAGLHLLLEPLDGRGEKELVMQAAKHGVRVYGLGEMMIPEAPSPKRQAVLLGYAGLTEKELEEGCGLLGQVWKIR